MPTVHTDLAAVEIAQYKQLRDEVGSRVRADHPYISFLASLPVAPAFVLTYHEYQLAGLYGEGSWQLHIWYIVGTRKLFGVPLWMS